MRLTSLSRLVVNAAALAAVLAAVLGAVLLPAPAASAQAGGGYDLAWSQAGAGAAATGDAYSLTAAIGRPDAAASTGGGYALTGGFLPGSQLGPGAYLPLLLRGQ